VFFALQDLPGLLLVLPLGAFTIEFSAHIPSHPIVWAIGPLIQDDIHFEIPFFHLFFTIGTPDNKKSPASRGFCSVILSAWDET
jgi:hypothetical protein